MTFATLTPEERAELEYLCAWIATDKNDLLKNPHTILKSGLDQFPKEQPQAVKPAMKRACISIEKAINDSKSRMENGHSSQANFDLFICDLRRVVEYLKAR